jgi:hypothetical protein
MPDLRPVFKSAFTGPGEEDFLGDNGTDGPRGRRPVIFDILGPDQEKSLLPGDLKLVLHVNPRTMQLSYSKQTTRTQTRGGFVEFHWGDAAEEITFEAATGGFMRLYTGLSNVTGGRGGGQGRRETIAYDKYLDLLSLFHNNGAIYDISGNIVVQGYIKITFDGGVHIGWFDGDFTVREDANQPYMFNMSTRFIIDREIMTFRSAPLWDFNRSELAVTDNDRLAFQDTSTAVLDPVLDADNSPIGLLGRDRFSEEDF